MSVEDKLRFIRRMIENVPDSGTGDIALELLVGMQHSFAELYCNDRKIIELLSKIESGAATHLDVQAYAARVGDLASTSMLSNLNTGVLPGGKLYYNIAERTILPTMQAGHDLINDAAVAVETELRRRAGIGIKPMQPGLDVDRVGAIINKACAAEQYADAAYVLDEPVKNTMQSAVDKFIQANAGQLQRLGMRPKITRRVVGSCCAWCAGLAGTYDYGDEPKPEFYQRHDSCRCAVIYDPGTGRVQNAHNRKWYASDAQALAARQQARRFGLAEQIAQYPARLQAYTPDKLKAALEENGYEIHPLAKGKLKGVRFEDGGGFKVNFPDGGLLQYHPAQGSRHAGAYYKISTGKKGTIRYDLNRKEKES